jgi:hypothetical protein
VVQHDDVDAALAEQFEPFFTAIDVIVDIAAPMHGLFDQTGKPRIIIDVEHMRCAVGHDLSRPRESA